MIVRFDLERCAPAVPDVDDSGVFARRNYDSLAAGGQPLKMNPGRLVRTVLRPHHRKDTELDQVWFASEQLLQTIEFFRSEVVGGDYFWSDCFHKQKSEGTKQKAEK